MLDGKAPCQVITQRLHAITLGGMMASGDKADAIFAGTVEGLLGRFAGQVQVDARGNRLIDIVLTSASSPTDSANHRLAFDQQRLTTEHLMHMAGEIAWAHGLDQ